MPVGEPYSGDLVPEEGPGVGVKRWRVRDSAEDLSLPAYQFEQNPREMTSPYPTKTVNARPVTAPDGQILMTEGGKVPADWSFTGSIRTRDQFENMEFWFSRKEPLSRLWLWDHLGRRLTIVPYAFEPTPRRAIGVYWRHDYTVKAWCLDVQHHGFAG